MSNALEEDRPWHFRGLAGIDILRLVLLSIAALIAVTLGINFLFEAQRPNNASAPPVATAPPTAFHAPTQSLLALREKIEAEITQQSPDYARFFERLKAVLPNEYEQILDGFANQAAEGTDMSNIDALVSQAVRDIRISNGVLAAKADGPALSHIFDLQLQMMRALAAKNAKLCVDFLYGGASEAFFQFSAENRKLVSDMAIAGLDAIASGRAGKIDRAAPTDADFTELESGLKTQGLTNAETAAILDGKTPNPPIPDARMCEVGQTYLKTLASLPEEVRLRIYGLAVELMARS